MCIRALNPLCKIGVSFCLFAAAFPAHAQTGGAVPVKPGLWETQSTSKTAMSLPPEMEARIAAMPPDRQAMVRSRMAGAAPAQTVTTRSCVAAQTNLDSFLKEAQQKGVNCTFSNVTKNGSGVSFDTACSNPQWTAKGHSDVQMSDSDHVTGTMHMTADITTPNGQTHATVENTIHAKYLGASCGELKPGASQEVN